MLTLDVLYDPKNKINFDGAVPSDLIWFKDGVHYLHRRTDPKTQKTEWLKVHGATGVVTPFFQSPTADKDGRFTVNASGTALLLTRANDLFYPRLRPAGETDPVRLTGGVHSMIAEQFSPVGKTVSFVRDNDLWVVDIESKRERQLTVGGNEKLLNGRLDWVYQEELYGRGNFKGY